MTFTLVYLHIPVKLVDLIIRSLAFDYAFELVRMELSRLKNILNQLLIAAAFINIFV